MERAIFIVVPLLTPDEDTLFLFDLTNFNTSSQELVVDSIGSDNLLASGSVYFVTGPMSSSIRASESDAFKKFNVSDAFMTASRGNCTVLAWLWPATGHGNEVFWLGPNGGNPESEATNFTIRWTLGSDNRWDYLSEYGAGSNRTFAQSVGGLTSGEWNHVGLVRRLTGSNLAVDIYTNGNLDQTLEGAASLPGDTAGSDLPDQSIDWDGLIRSVKFISGALSASHIESEYSSSLSNNMLHGSGTLTGEVISLWQFNEEPIFPNRGTAAPHLSVTDVDAFNALPLVEDTESSVALLAGQLTITDLFSEDIAATINDNDITVDFWFRLLDTAQEQRLVQWSGPGESQAGNFLWTVDISSGDKITFFAENGAGNNINGIPSYTSTFTFDNSYRYVPTHLAMVRTVNTSVSEIYLDYYVNGQLMDQSSGSTTIAIPDGGTIGRLWIGGDPNGPDTINMQQLRITKRALSGSEILSAYQAGTTSSLQPSTLQPIELFRGYSTISGSFVYFRSDEVQESGLIDIVKIKTLFEPES